MDEWITKTLDLSEVQTTIVMDSEGVQIFYKRYGNDAHVFFDPKTRREANRMSIALRMASKHLEEVGKGLIGRLEESERLHNERP